MGNFEPDYFLQLKQIINETNNRVKNIEKYVIMNSKKNVIEDYEICNEILSEKKYICIDDIIEHPILKLKYINYLTIKRLLDDFKSNYEELAEKKIGRGSKRYIYKKEDETKVLKMLGEKRHLQRKKITGSEIDDVKNYLLELKEQNITQSVNTAPNVFRAKLGIKSPSKVRRILKDLQSQGIISINNWRIYVND